MKKSNDVAELDELPEVDYSQIPKDIEDAVNRKPYVVDRKAKLTWDKRQFIIRIPTEIAKELKLTTDNQIRFLLTKPLPGSEDKPKLEIKLI